MSGAIPLLSLVPLSLHLGYETGVLAAQVIISIVKLKEPIELVTEGDGSHDLSLSLFFTFLAEINASASVCVFRIVALVAFFLTYLSHLILFDR